MNFDFPTLLVAATFVTGLIWGLDALIWAPQRKRAVVSRISGEDVAKAAEAVREPLLVEYSRSFFPVILLVLLIRSFMVEPFRIPSGSMMPTLLIGDFILVNKFSYGIRLPVINTKIINIGTPQRGDIIVFRYPEDPSVDFIKRVIGVPGDHVAYHNKVLTVNGEVIPEQYLGSYEGDGGGAGMTGASLRKETLNKVQHDILIMPERESRDADLIVPEGQYFVMGDNRDNSRDSRYWGTVPDQNLVGKAFMIWMNWDRDASSTIDWHRIGTMVH